MTAQFLPTPSARRATVSLVQLLDDFFISTHALREEGDRGPRRRCDRPRAISTHALREEGDGLPVVVVHQGHNISTHALREEGD